MKVVLSEDKVIELNTNSINVSHKYEAVGIEKLYKVKSSRRVLAKDYVESGIPFYRGKEITNRSFRINESEKYISNKKYQELKGLTGVPNVGDLLITAVGTIGNLMLVENNQSFYFKDGNVIWLQRDAEINSLYVRYFLESEQGVGAIVSMGGGTAYGAISMDSLKTLQLLIPPLEQQNNIAEILSTQESIIEDIKSLIEKNKKRLKYLSKELLSGKIRVKEENGETIFYKNPEDNWKTVEMNGEDVEIPSDWVVDNVANRANFIKGISIPEKKMNYDGIGLKYLKTTELWLESSSKRETCYYDGVIDSKYMKNKDDYVFSLDGFNDEPGKGTLGLVSNEDEGIVSSHFFKITKDNHLYFTITILESKSLQDKIIELSEGTTVKSSAKYLKTIQGSYPNSKTELELISKVLEAVYLSIDDYKELVSLEKQRFQWLLDNLMSGKYIVTKEED